MDLTAPHTWIGTRIETCRRPCTETWLPLAELGANPDKAQLLGAFLDAAHLESASLRDVSAGMDAISKALTQGARFAAARPAPDVYERGLAEQWRVIGCAPEGAPYVLGKLVEALDTGNSPFARDSPQVPPLASAFLLPTPHKKPASEGGSEAG